MKDSIEALSISLTGLGNPYFSDATLAGPDPSNSKTCKELMASGDVKAFRAKYSTDSDSSEVIMVTVHNNCRLRLPGQKVQAQADIEEFVTCVNELSCFRTHLESLEMYGRAVVPVSTLSIGTRVCQRQK